MKNQNINLNNLIVTINALPYVSETYVRRDIEDGVKFLTFEEVIQELEFDTTLTEFNSSLCSRRDYLRVDGEIVTLHDYLIQDGCNHIPDTEIKCELTLDEKIERIRNAQNIELILEGCNDVDCHIFSKLEDGRYAYARIYETR